MRVARILVLSLSVALVVASPAAAAPTDSPLLIRQLDVGNEYVMLQMTVAGQQSLTGETLDLYGSAGALTRTIPLSGSVPNGQSQRTVLISNESGPSASADFVVADQNALSPVGGAVCISGVYPADCVTWGTFPGRLTPIGASLPNPQSSNAGVDPKSGKTFPIVTLSRTTVWGCSSWLDPLDDSNNSFEDFSVLSTVGVRGNSSPVSEAAPCVPETLFNDTPRNPTNDTTPTFAFGEVPPAYDATFECRLDSAPFADCPRSGNTLGPLEDGFYTFEAAATMHVAGNTDPTPAAWTFEVDTVPPDTSITSTPGPVSSGFSASFSFASSEHNPTFLCRLDGGPVQACEPGKTYFFLADGFHTFRVWASDQATNQDPTPAEHVFFVDTSFGDTFPPFTNITSGPPKNTKQTSARFTYSSNEAGGRFECRLDQGAFTPCEATGKSYSGLRNGQRIFQVRAVDRAGNVDVSPKAYAWTVEGPSPETKITKAPPGVIRLGGKRRMTSIAFFFSSSRPDSEFACRLGKGRFHRCESPERFRVGPGRHTFQVYAIDSLGNRDPVAARRIFRVIRRGASKGIFG